ncbi:MAG: exodeoxyribonuclease V subunit beta [Pseudomonadales bacterium]|nr:exodeoxyribonuclease V subunit beta [Pseudomonadales bacterium]
MKSQPFDALTFPLEKTQLIEASAGTGKTFSLASLYLRLLVEREFDVRDILVMTYTRAATQELRERIRARIAGAAALAANLHTAVPGNVEERFAMDVLNARTRVEAPAALAARLRDAAVRMDEATIATIHSFAQQAASENAFESALPFDRGTQVDDAAIIEAAVADYWRSQVLAHPESLGPLIASYWPVPGKLLDELRLPLDRPHAAVAVPDRDELLRLSAAARTAWSSDRDSLESILVEVASTGKFYAGKALSKRFPDTSAVGRHLQEIDRAFEHTCAGIAIVPDWVRDLCTPEGIDTNFHKAVNARDRLLPLPFIQALAGLAPRIRPLLRHNALQQVRANLAQRKQASRSFSYADMIGALYDAITHPDRGRALADALHRTWPVALVDEFQDTDPAQYAILRAIYHGRDAGALVLIGDPKQAIYGFRGGDVHAYLQARSDAAGCYHLATNFRSTGAVLRSIEALFNGPAGQTQSGPFLQPTIRFQPVDAGRTRGDRVLELAGRELPAVTVWHVADEDTRAAAEARFVDATVTEICTLLDPDSGYRVRGDGERHVQPADIAVLVNTNAQAEQVQRALARRGVASVCLQRETVFASDEARHLLLLLVTVAGGARPEAVRAALTTPLFGNRLSDLHALENDDNAWQHAVSRFQDAADTWRRHGILAVLEPLFQQASARLLALQDGERRMTNYLHLAELLSARDAVSFGQAHLVRWLGRQIVEPDQEGDADAQLLRLESDDRLVRIATTHRVKGLEFDIVFLPFGISLGPKIGKSAWVIHDAHGQAHVCFAAEEDNHQDQAVLEARAESLRLLYVALTRAAQALYLGWGAVKGAPNAALAWLLHADQEPAIDRIVDARTKLPDWFTARAVADALSAWAARAGGSVRVVPPPAPLPAHYRIDAGSPPEGNARTDLPAPRQDWSVFSFSRLVAGGRLHSTRTGTDDEVADDTLRVEAAPAVPDTALPLQGAAFGSAVHGMLERLDFATWPAPDAPATTATLELARAQLLSAGISLAARPDAEAILTAVCQLVARTLHTPLPHIGALAQLPPTRRRTEMEFHMRLGGERVARVLTVLHAQGYAVSLAPDRAQQTLSGLMQGYIDLLVEADGRYWVVDYKTNNLGSRFADYHTEALAAAVRHGNYDLQYLIYLVALHRHLTFALPDYDPARHLGGAIYLFVRGLDGNGADTGVHVDHPGVDCILALDALLDGREARG